MSASSPIPLFESLRRTNEEGEEFWWARELGKALDYAEFRNFLPVIEKARTACAESGHAVPDHFVEMHEMVEIGSGARRPMPSFALTRYACYLIVQNGDPSKPLIALGQTYFAAQTRRQELQDDAAFARLTEDGKGLKKSQKILDHMGSTELAANLFRATQTEDKLRRDEVQGKTKANKTHFEVGKKVRQTIEELGGVMPENLPTPPDSIRTLETRRRKELGGGE